jgi:hypothetical protein
MRKTLFLLTVALMVGPGCANHSNPQVGNTVVSRNTPTPASATSPIAENSREPSHEIKKPKDVPTEFKEIDFKNISYPISWKHRTIPLKDGHVEYFEDKYLGNAWFDFEAVDYVDLTGNGKLNAIVQLHAVMCGASCDGGSQFFYFFSVKGSKLTLLSRIESGSLGYGACGLRSFALEKRSLVLEVFHVCRFDGTSLKAANDPHPNPNAQVGKFVADKFTRFVFAFSGNRFHLKTREVSPNPQEDISNYSSKVTISND